MTTEYLEQWRRGKEVSIRSEKDKAILNLLLGIIAFNTGVISLILSLSQH